MSYPNTPQTQTFVNGSTALQKWLRVFNVAGELQPASDTELENGVVSHFVAPGTRVGVQLLHNEGLWTFVANDAISAYDPVYRGPNGTVASTGTSQIGTAEGTSTQQFDHIWVRIIGSGAGGVPGPPGPQGEQGEQGDPGADGADGADGAQGIQGEQGIQGDPGPQGDQGDQGIQGIQGDQGDQGIQGIQGDQGIQGPAGQDGEDGIGVKEIDWDMQSVPDGTTTVDITNATVDQIYINFQLTGPTADVVTNMTGAVVEQILFLRIPPHKAVHGGSGAGAIQLDNSKGWILARPLETTSWILLGLRYIASQDQYEEFSRSKLDD